MAAKNSENTGKVGKGNPPKHAQFKKGVSGNPKGRPEGAKNRATLYKKWVELAAKVEGLDGKEAEGTFEDLIVIRVIRKAMDEGDITAAKEIFDSLYGKITDKIQHSSDPEAPVIFQVDGRFKDSTENS